MRASTVDKKVIVLDELAHSSQPFPWPTFSNNQVLDHEFLSSSDKDIEGIKKLIELAGPILKSYNFAEIVLSVTTRNGYKFNSEIK
ncbi:hypothetical protein HGT71_01025 [Rosenbergiella epipactidis]|uniref:hypothetical protein n=1 Tax=Rosenbergiella epipactidis TaxID=1544694 RepID=UPI001BDA89E6|nr:hypothetical protein [Rosenbergiella epipactidis]MBT0716873.1 hypothetical protein [Rosenbergiella epipactidis]